MRRTIYLIVYYLFIYLFMYLIFIYIFIYLFIHLFIYLCRFMYYFLFFVYYVWLCMYSFIYLHIYLCIPFCCLPLPTVLWLSPGTRCPTISWPSMPPVSPLALLSCQWNRRPPSGDATFFFARLQRRAERKSRSSMGSTRNSDWVRYSTWFFARLLEEGKEKVKVAYMDSTSNSDFAR